MDLHATAKGRARMGVWFVNCQRLTLIDRVVHATPDANVKYEDLTPLP